MKLSAGATVCEVDTSALYPRRFQILSLLQATRHRCSYLSHSESEELNDHTVVLTVCNYDPRLLGNQKYVDNIRRRLEHEAEMLITPENALPEPVDFFYTENAEDPFGFEEAARYKQTEPVLVTERYHGIPLDRLIQEGGASPEWRALEIGIKLCALLAGLHKHGVLAYELRPEDFLVDEADHDRLWILGCANHQHMRSNGKVAISDLVVPLSDFDFTAPEVEGGRGALDIRADIYSFGALLLFLLTARKPKELLGEGKGRGALHSLQHLAPETCRLLGRCLAADPDSRLPDCQALRQELEEARDLAKEPAPTAIQEASVTLEGRRLVLRWELPAGWSGEEGLVVRRFTGRAGEPPDPSTWETILDQSPSAAVTLEDECLAPGATLHYAIFSQQPGPRGARLAHPLLLSVTVPDQSTAREFLIGFLTSPGLVLWGVTALIKQGASRILRGRARSSASGPDPRADTSVGPPDSPQTRGEHR